MLSSVLQISYSQLIILVIHSEDCIWKWIHYFNIRRHNTFTIYEAEKGRQWLKRVWERYHSTLQLFHSHPPLHCPVQMKIENSNSFILCARSRSNKLLSILFSFTRWFVWQTHSFYSMLVFNTRYSIRYILQSTCVFVLDDVRACVLFFPT